MCIHVIIIIIIIKAAYTYIHTGFAAELGVSTTQIPIQGEQEEKKKI
jgi:hypothetical protein